MKDKISESLSILFAPLEDAIKQNNQENNFETNHPWYHRLTLVEAAGLVDVEYQGEYEIWLDDNTTVTILENLLKILTHPDFAPRLRSFTYLTDAALAANGTYDYNIDPLVDGEHQFPNLIHLSLAQGHGEHGYKILTSPQSGDDWYEAGVLSHLLDKTPFLEELVIPVPPNQSFFQGCQHPLRSLDVDAGFDCVDFIRNLAACSRFPNIQRLVFTDFRQYYLDDWRTQTTSFEDYILFFNSQIASQLQSISLREVNLTPKQVDEILAIRSKGVDITCHQVSGQQ
jgi:hypothetical protein